MSETAARSVEQIPISSARQMVGASPNVAVKPVSLAVKKYLIDHGYAPNKLGRATTNHRTGIVVGVSGGADSLALAVAAIDLANRWGVPILTVTVDHGIRPESASEAAKVRNLMDHLGATKAVVRGRRKKDQAAETQNIMGGNFQPISEKRKNLGPEGQARDFRYSELVASAREFAENFGLEQVELLVGHTQDDQAETVLLRLGRGAGAHSLSAMRQRKTLSSVGTSFENSAIVRADPSPTSTQISLGRPLLGLRRSQTEAFCQELALPIVCDPSNHPDGPWKTKDNQALRRSAVREWAIPQLQRALGQDPVPALARTASQLQEDDDALTLWASETLRRSRELDNQTEPTSANGELELNLGISCYRLGPIAEQPSAVRKRVLKQMAIEQGAIPGGILAVHLASLDRLISEWHGQGAVQLPGRINIQRRGEYLWVSSATAAGGPPSVPT